MSGPLLDLGSGVTLEFTSWSPDRTSNPQYRDLPDVEKFGALVEHPLASAETGRCLGSITFEGPVQSKLEPSVAKWKVVSWEPLTLAPSILCACGFHGFIRDGHWVPA